MNIILKWQFAFSCDTLANELVLSHYVKFVKFSRDNIHIKKTLFYHWVVIMYTFLKLIKKLFNYLLSFTKKQFTLCKLVSIMSLIWANEIIDFYQNMVLVIFIWTNYKHLFFTLIKVWSLRVSGYRYKATLCMGTLFHWN